MNRRAFLGGLALAPLAGPAVVAAVPDTSRAVVYRRLVVDARPTGLMGERAPEGIIPLARDATGRLGEATAKLAQESERVSAATARITVRLDAIRQKYEQVLAEQQRFQKALAQPDAGAAVT